MCIYVGKISKTKHQNKDKVLLQQEFGTGTENVKKRTFSSEKPKRFYLIDRESYCY